MDAAVSFRIAAAPADLTTFAACLRGTLVRPDDAVLTGPFMVESVADSTMGRA